MKKSMVFVLVAALMLAMFAGVAKGKPAGKGKPAKVPAVAYVFEGTVASVDETAGTVTVNVEDANKFAASYIGGQVTVAVESATKIKKDDARATLADLAADDEVVVKDRAPKGATGFTADIVVANTPATESEPVL